MSTNRIKGDIRNKHHGIGYRVGYGLGMRTPGPDPTCTEFGWDGAAGAYASVDPVNNVTIFYAQHVLESPNVPLREWIYRTVRADVLGEKVHVPIVYDDDTDPTL